MTPSTLRFSKDDTRESALRKAGIFYDHIADAHLTKFASAISQADVSCEDMVAAIDQGRLMAAEGRAPFLAHVADVLDEILAGRDRGRCADMLAANRNECERRH